MRHINIEIKAKIQDQSSIREILKSKGAEFRGIDHQVDTYFKVNSGRLKLREGNIENFLIYYHRQNIKGPKQSEINLYKLRPNQGLKEILTNSLDILVTVDKQREIYFIDNVKFHIDSVKDLGRFIEIEAIGDEIDVNKNKLLEQCRDYMRLLKVNEKDLVDCSYSDLLLKRGEE